MDTDARTSEDGGANPPASIRAMSIKARLRRSARRREVVDAYAAGIIDGEGSVLLLRDRKADRFRTPTVSVTSTDRPLIDFLVRHFGGHTRVQKRRKATYREAWIWHVRYRDAFGLLRRVYPYLLTPSRRERTRLLLEEYPGVTVRNGQYTDEEAQAKDAFEARFLAA